MRPSKCCGTCGWGELYQYYPYPVPGFDSFVQCTAPVPSSLRNVLRLHPKNIMAPTEGTNCPVWKPKEGEDANSNSQ